MKKKEPFHFDATKYAKIIGAKKVTNEMIKTANSITEAKLNGTWAQIVNFGLPPITDMEGRSEC